MGVREGVFVVLSSDRQTEGMYSVYCIIYPKKTTRKGRSLSLLIRSRSTSSAAVVGDEEEEVHYQESAVTNNLPAAFV